MTIWVMILVTSSGTSVPTMTSSVRSTAHYASSDACAKDLSTVLADIKSGKLVAGGADCVAVTVPGSAK